MRKGPISVFTETGHENNHVHCPAYLEYIVLIDHIYMWTVDYSKRLHHLNLTLPLCCQYGLNGFKRVQHL